MAPNFFMFVRNISYRTGKSESLDILSKTKETNVVLEKLFAKKINEIIKIVCYFSEENYGNHSNRTSTRG